MGLLFFGLAFPLPSISGTCGHPGPRGCPRRKRVALLQAPAAGDGGKDLQKSGGLFKN